MTEIISILPKIRTLVLATRNPGKVRELQALLGPLGYSAITAAQAGYDGEPEETGKTFRGNALIKARAVADQVGQMVLADDSGLEVEALGGAPGVYSARYAGPKSGDAENRAKLLAAMGDEHHRAARFVCALCLLVTNTEPLFFEGECRGVIAAAAAGTNGFGYDALFIPQGETRTFAEMEASEKNPRSHRGRATAELRRYLERLTE